jgi:hypothetical protein
VLGNVSLRKIAISLEIARHHLLPENCKAAFNPYASICKEEFEVI